MKNTGINRWLTVAMAITLFAFGLPLTAQVEFNTFYSDHLNINNTGMYVLGGWALTNMAAGAYGWARLDGQQKYFSQMNLFWNVVNLSIAGFALYSNSRVDITLLSQEELLSKMVKTENLYLINAGLDILYMGGGLLMRHYAKRSVKSYDLLRGYGNAVILQGAFLFVFDAVMYGIVNSHRLGSGSWISAESGFLANPGIDFGVGIQGFRMAISF